MKITVISNQDATHVITNNSNRILLMEAVREAAASLQFPCGGNGSCGKCKVRAAGALSEPTTAEKRLLGDELDKGVRLACYTYAEGDCTIWLDANKNTKILTDGLTQSLSTLDQRAGFGFAVDIGTTTVAVCLYHLLNGEVLSKKAFPNPQGYYGADVVSRIQAALDGRADALKASIQTAVESAMKEACQDADIPFMEVTDAVITGNTTMLYLFCGIGVSPLSAAPFKIHEYFGNNSPVSIAFHTFPNMKISFPATISAFVGSDITCSMLACHIRQQDGISILADIGTNGEMALYENGSLVCCSTAAGPAFEGAGIEMGVSATDGAIDRIFVEGGHLCYTTIGNIPAIGLCGSGLIDAVAACLKLNLIDATGLIDEAAGDSYITILNDRPAIKIGDSPVLLTQEDIRSVQLAKSAICAGIRSLLHALNKNESEVTRLFLAGGFGSYLNPESASAIGLIPKSLRHKTIAAGNAAVAGAGAMLLSAGERKESEAIANIAKEIELSTSPYFMNQYIEDMMFPLC